MPNFIQRAIFGSNFLTVGKHYLVRSRNDQVKAKKSMPTT